jgi:hypothetical protein
MTGRWIYLFQIQGVPQPIFFKNISNTGNYIICKLVGCRNNRAAIGTRIKLYAGNLFEIREISGGNGSGTQDMLWQHFGVGSHSMIDSIIVNWPYGNTPEIQKLTNISVNQTITIQECLIGIINNEVPVKFELKQNYPNPFNPSTQIEYSLIKPSIVKLTVYDLMGRLLKALVNEHQSQGTYKVEFDGTNLASGTYVYKLETNDPGSKSGTGFTDVKKMVLLK